MERLTGRRRRDGHAYIVGCPNFVLPKIAGLIIQQTVDRLAAYEDTGLEPEKVVWLKEMIDVAFAEDTSKIERLRELAQADQDGRCVVVPEGGYSDKDGEKALKNAMYVCSFTNNAVNRYITDAIAEKLTREEADAAIRREQDDN